MAEKKLYLVHVEPKPFDMYVFAESEAAARSLARSHADDELDNIGSDYHVTMGHEVTSLDGVHGDWRGALPYGEDDRTIEELFVGPAK